MDRPNVPKSDGAIFVNNDKQKETHPDYRGQIKVTREQIDKLVQMGQMGLEPSLTIGAWNRNAKETGQFYIYLGTEVYIKSEHQQQAPQQGYGQPAQAQPQGQPNAYQPPVQQQQPQGFRQDQPVQQAPPQQQYQQQAQPPMQPQQQQAQGQAPVQPMQPQGQPVPNAGFEDDDIPF